MENSVQPESSPLVRRIGPNITKVLVASIWAGALVAASVGVALALQPEAIPVFMEAMTPVVVWAQEMGSKAFLLAVGAGGGGVGGVALGRKKTTS